jgi:copper chaperone NosL
VPEDEECAVCGMMPAEHPEWNAQLVHEDETRTHFCSSGCLAAYTVDPQRFDGPDSEIATAWATGYETGELVAAADASFVRVTNPDHVDDIMMMNPTPFADRSDAEAFVGQFDSYDETDIITYDEFDRDLAELYRAEFFDEG